MEKQRDNHIEQNVTEQHTTEQGANFMVVLVSLVIVFKKQINTLLENIFKQINTKSKEVY